LEVLFWGRGTYFDRRYLGGSLRRLGHKRYFLHDRRWLVGGRDCC
jgi:hypothetical protein